MSAADPTRPGVPDLARGTRVRLHPRRGADITDLALAGRVAEVDRVEEETDGEIHVVVMLADDPGRDLGAMSQIGHRFFFRPEELEKLPEEGVPQRQVLAAGLGDSFVPGGDVPARVVARLRADRAVPGLHLADFGIRGNDLAHALTEGYVAALVLAATRRGRAPGALTVTDAPMTSPEDVRHTAATDPFAVLRRATASGVSFHRVVVVECETAETPDFAADHVVAEAVELATRLIDELTADRTTDSPSATQ